MIYALLFAMNYSSIKRQLSIIQTREVPKLPTVNGSFIAVELNTESDVKPHTDCLTTSYQLPPFIF